MKLYLLPIIVATSMIGFSNAASACIDFSGNYVEKIKSNDDVKIVIRQNACSDFKHLYITSDLVVGITAITDNAWRSSVRNPGEYDEHIRLKRAKHAGNSLVISQVESYKKLDTVSYDIKYEFVASDELQMTTHAIEADGSTTDDTVSFIKIDMLK